MYGVWSQLYEILEQAKLTSGGRNQNSDCFVRGREAVWKDFLECWKFSESLSNSQNWMLFLRSEYFYYTWIFKNEV